MHIYIYDSLLEDKKYQPQLHRIESKITDLGLGGRVCRLSPLKNVRDMLVEELRREPKTVIALGGDTFLTEVVSWMRGVQIPLGVVPIGESNNLVSGLGINENNAAQVLAARRIIPMDLGAVDGRTFLRSAEIFGNNIQVIIDGSYRVVLHKNQSLKIVNYLLDNEDYFLKNRPSPQNGQLTLVAESKETSLWKKEKVTEQTALNFKQLEIVGQDVRAILDNNLEVKNVRTAEILPGALNLIVGRSREI